MQPLQPLAVCSFHMLFSLFSSRSNCNLLLKLRKKTSSSSCAPPSSEPALHTRYFPPMPPLVIFWRFKAQPALMRGQVPRYIARLLSNGNVTLNFCIWHMVNLLWAWAPSLSSPLHEIGILTLSRLNFGRRR